MLLEATYLGAHFCRHVQRIGLIGQDDIDIPASRTSDRDLHESSPAWSNSVKEMLDDPALDAIVDAGTRVRVGPHRQVRPEHIGDPDEDGGARLR